MHGAGQQGLGVEWVVGDEPSLTEDEQCLAGGVDDVRSVEARIGLLQEPLLDDLVRRAIQRHVDVVRILERTDDILDDRAADRGVQRDGASLGLGELGELREPFVAVEPVDRREDLVERCGVCAAVGAAPGEPHREQQAQKCGQDGEPSRATHREIIVALTDGAHATDGDLQSPARAAAGTACGDGGDADGGGRRGHARGRPAGAPRLAELDAGRRHLPRCLPRRVRRRTPGRGGTDDGGLRRRCRGDRVGDRPRSCVRARPDRHPGPPDAVRPRDRAARPAGRSRSTIARISSSGRGTARSTIASRRTWSTLAAPRCRA